MRQYLILTALVLSLSALSGCGLMLGPGEPSKGEIEAMLEEGLSDGARIEKLELLSREVDDSGKYTYKINATVGGSVSGSLKGKVSCQKTNGNTTWTSSLSGVYK